MAAGLSIGITVSCEMSGLDISCSVEISWVADVDSFVGTNETRENSTLEVWVFGGSSRGEEGFQMDTGVFGGTLGMSSMSI